MNNTATTATSTATSKVYAAKQKAGNAFDAFYDAELAYLAAKEAWDAAYDLYAAVAGIPKVRR